VDRCVWWVGPSGSVPAVLTAGLLDPPESPWKDAYHGWVLGSGAFIERVKAMIRGQPSRERRRESRLLLSVPLSRIIEVVCDFYQIEPTELSERRSRHPARAGLVYLARRHTLATNAELAAVLGLEAASDQDN
jgi:hypothetical protein